MKTSTTMSIIAAMIAAATFTFARAEILIATAGPFEGQYSWMGEQYRQGTRMAVADLNEHGGVLGQRVDFVVGDDDCDAGQAVAVARNLVSQGVVFVAGHFCSGASIPASKVYEAERVLMISPSSTNPKLTDEGGNNVFRVCGRDDQQGQIAGDYLADHWYDKRIAILHDGTVYGKGLADQTRTQLEKRGVAEVMYETYGAGKHDYSELISKLRAADVDVFYVGGYSTEAALMLRQARDAGSQIQLVSGDAIATDEFWLITGESGEGALMTFFPDPRKNKEAEKVVAKFREEGYEPEGYTLYAYAAFQVWAQATEKAGSLDLDKIVEIMREDEFDTVLGRLSFDEKGDLKGIGFVWYVWKNGTYELLN